MELLNEIVSSEIFQIILKLLLSAFLTGIIGMERSSLSKPAGFGTYSIVGLSSALVVMASQYMSTYYDIDASRIPSQILAGIGFIGAGTIIRTGINVRGVTTAAGILSVTCIGIAVGMGYYEAAIVSSLLVFFILSINHNITTKFEKFDNLNISVEYLNDSDALEYINSYFKEKNITIQSIRKEIKDKKISTVNIDAVYETRKISRSQIIGKLIENKSIVEVNEENSLV